MELDGKTFDVSPENFENFFNVLNGIEKPLLSKDISETPVTDDQRKQYCIYIVADHAFGLPKDIKEKLEPFIDY